VLNATGPVDPEIVATDLDSPMMIVLDGGNLYWQGRVRVLAK